MAGWGRGLFGTEPDANGQNDERQSNSPMTADEAKEPHPLEGSH